MSSRMCRCLEHAYTHIFHFFQTTTRIFISSGKVKKALTVIGDLMWKPFDDRFADTMERLHSYRDLIRLELSLLIARSMNDAGRITAAEQAFAKEERVQAKMARDTIGKTASMTTETGNMLCQQRKEQSVQQIKQWLSAPDFAEVPIHAQNLREDGTANWIFDRSQFIRWKESEWEIKTALDQSTMGENGLWVYGNPGCGKTVLASHVLKEFQRDSQSNTSAGICYFFFASGNLKSSAIAAAYRSILTQLVHSHHDDGDLIDTFNFIMGGFGSSGSLQATSGDLEALIKLCLRRLPTYIIIDGLDECEDVNDFIKDLLWLSNNSPTKILLFGRTNIARMNRVFPGSLRLDMDRPTITEDVVVFLSSRVDAFIEDDLLPYGSNVSDLVECLAKGADGMFLWARLMINYLGSSVLTPFQRVRTIQSVIMPEGLDIMYRRISDLVAKAGRTHLQLARRILTWAAFATESITAEELNDVLTFKDSGVEGHKFRDIQETISVICGGLVECYRPWNSPPDSQEMIVRCIHLSVKEHFSPSVMPRIEEKTTALSLPAKPLAHLELLDSCLGYMKFYQPLIQPGGMVQAAGKFAKYASYKWPFHLSEAFYGGDPDIEPNIVEFSEKAESTLEDMTKFLEDPTANKSWIGMYYSYAQGRDYDSPSTQFLMNNFHWMSFTETQDLSYPRAPLLRNLKIILRDWIPDINRLCTEWGARLAAAPQIIWDEVPAFVNSKFLGISSSAIITSFGPTTLRGHNCSSKPLCTISKTAGNNQTTSVLTVWPSKVYEQCWESKDPDLRAFNYSPPYQDWSARYEVWQHEHTGRKIVDAIIPLCPIEISALLRQGYHLTVNDPSAWGISFPLAISTDLLSVVILRTIYSCSIDNNGALKRIESALVPMDFDPDISRKWETTFKKIPQDWYNYEFMFTADDQYLLFWDRHHYEKHTSFFGRMLAPTNTMAAFTVSRQPPLTVDFINKISLQRDIGFSQVKFHPYQPFITFVLEKEVHLWQFLNYQSNQLTVLAKQEENEDMTFSACGKFLILIGPRLSSPSVIPLPENLQDCDPSHVGDTHNTTDRDEKSERPPDGQTQSLLAPGQIVQFPSDLSFSNGQKGLITVSTGDAVTINLSLGSEEATYSLEIVSLPRWKGIEHVTPTMIMPRADEKSVKVVLNKFCEDEYSLSNPTDARLPVLIARDRSAIRLLTPSKSGQMDIRSILNSGSSGDVDSPAVKDGLHDTGEEDINLGVREKDESSEKALSKKYIGEGKKRRLSEETLSNHEVRKRITLPELIARNTPVDSILDDLLDHNASLFRTKERDSEMN
ncbi:hypothetical protein P154DRAFT_501082 [Amniculicola lignicola CBS 123094]|uniref:Nephrocystin 3-like N-terminal domain-containing protein n=1 Tax=Amniculicola lignicola CBS 123094 TaxID=1392246 RepID=A0A6A5W1R5_9PLEO|nr:hypothetical protein P154DRAFT_501082 [Amniculicola lignicola CBS 123094]